MRPEHAVFVAGHRGLVGSALVRALRRRAEREGRSPRVLTRARAELDLRDRDAVERFFRAERPAHVYLAAAKVGGIVANSTRPGEFIHDNLQIQSNVIDAARRHGCVKLLFLGSSCIYPRDCPQPIQPEALLSGPLEPTNAPYAVAKIAGITMVQAYRRQYGFDAISLMPTNLYGPNDNYDPEGSHVIPGLLRRMEEARIAAQPAVEVWGSGRPLREFLYSDDLAEACLVAMERYSDPAPLNVGSGEEVSIRELAERVARAVGYEGALRFDPERPDGTPRKILDSSAVRALGWRPETSLALGLPAAVADFRAKRAQRRAA